MSLAQWRVVPRGLVLDLPTARHTGLGQYSSHASGAALRSVAPDAGVDVSATTEWRVILADDDVLLRQGTCHSPGARASTSSGQVGNATQLLTLVREHKPDL